MTSKTFRRRTGVIACLSAFTLASALVVGTAAYAVGRSEATATGSVPAAASPSAAASLLPHSRLPLDPYASYSP